MSELIIEGARRLDGEVKIQGAKNSILPIIAACIISKDECVIHNCPEISDVYASIKILNYLGCIVKFENNTLVINSRNIYKNNIPDFLMREMRSSIIFLGALISVSGQAKLCLPGGCELGPRPIDLHLDGLRQMGLIINESHGILNCETCISGLRGCNISLSFPSVGATENLILAAVCAHGETVINNIAKEPEIIDLTNFLIKCGAKIKYNGDSTIIIQGVKKLHGAEHAVISDRIAAITYMSAGVVTSGNLILRNISEENISSAIPVFEESGCIIKILDKNNLKIECPSRPYSNRIIRTMPYPGFPTDAQAPVMSMNTIADGTSMFIENIFSNRYKHVDELLRLGADIKVEGKVALVNGVKRLSGAKVKARDLRGAAALVIAGLGAEGVTTITGLNYLDRGYEHIEKILSNLGAKIKRT